MSNTIFVNLHHKTRYGTKSRQTVSPKKMFTTIYRTMRTRTTTIMMTRVYIVDNDDDEGVTCGTVGANFDVSDRMRLRHL